jgi:serine/threonine protein kinase
MLSSLVRHSSCQNLLVTSDWIVKCGDFGLSREAWHTGTMTRIGSVQWAAPELLRGEAYSHMIGEATTVIVAPCCSLLLLGFGVVCLFGFCYELYTQTPTHPYCS